MRHLLPLEHWFSRNWTNGRYWLGFLRLTQWRRRHRQAYKLPRRWRRCLAT